MAAAAVLIAGILPDVDFLSAIAGPHAFFLLHRTVTHSILGAAILAALVALLLWRMGQKSEIGRPPLGRLMMAAFCGAAGNLALCLGDTYGEKLFWPFSAKWYVLDLWPQLDPWLLLLLAVAVGLPWLLAIIGEEMGARRKRGASVSGIVALLLVAAYCGWRVKLHSEAMVLLYSNTYHGDRPDSVGAFPTSVSPFDWRGVVDTYNSVDVVPVPLGPNGDFEPNMAFTNYKVEDSAALKAAENAPGMAAWRNFAIFPFAQIEDTDRGEEATFRDLRFSETGTFLMDPTVTVDLTASNTITKVTWHFGPPQ